VSRPHRQGFETGAAYERAVAAWAETPEGKAEAAELERRRAVDARELAAETARAKVEGMTEMGLPAKDVRLVLGGHVVATGAVNALQRHEHKKYALIILSGNPGCGKTTAATDWIIGGKDGTPAPGSLFVKAAALARWDCYDTEEMDRLLLAPKLVIDDLGAEYMDAKGRFLSVLTEVVDVRYDAGRPTVITTWLNAEDFKLRYRERIVDRMREVGLFMVLDGVSMRGGTR
jgi:hypothetical protein